MRIQTQMRRRLAGRRSAGRRSALEAAVSVLVALGIVLGVRAAMGGAAVGPLAWASGGPVQTQGHGQAREGEGDGTDDRIRAVESLERQVQLLQMALEPRSPREAAERWAEGVKTRNGALQYAVLAPELREKMLEYYEGLGWVTGTSSPWVAGVEVVAERREVDGRWEYEIEYQWATSTGPAGKSREVLVVVQVGERWLVAQVTRADGQAVN
ncbi:MAG: hypothetical protein GX183_06405 [Firmicutes bacterium]|jgi:hypothetical protein|nr:hypothetical protein [Bacillota bacterium]